MTKRMERQRVLYSAKTKTSKVIATSSTRRPLSLPTSLQADEHPAPLASVESDVSLITKRESEFHKSAHLSEQSQRPASWADTRGEKASNKEVTVWKRESPNKELVRSTPFRSTIKIRNSKTCDLPKQNSSYRGYQKSHRPRSEGVTDAASSDKATPHRGIRSESDLSAVNNNIQQSLLNGSGGKVKYTSSTTLNRNAEGSRKPIYCATSIKGNTRSYPEKKDVQKLATPVAPKPNICSKVSAGHVGATNSQLSKTSTIESSPIVIRKEGPASSKENHVLPAPSRQDSDNTSKPCSRKVHSYQKLQRESSHTNSNTAFSLAKHQVKQYAYSEYPAKGLSPEMVSPLNYSQNENGKPPEMSIKSASTTRDYTAVSHVTGQYTDNVDQSKSNHRKPLATICISSNTPTSSTEDIHLHSGLNINNTETARNRHQQNDQNTPNNTVHLIDKDPTSIMHKEHASSDELDNFLGADFTPRWKRNSMRLATQGYTSMSDLTESMECLKGYEEEVSHSCKTPGYTSVVDTRDRKQTNADPEDASSAGTMCESDCERGEYEKISSDVSLNVEKVEKSHTDIDTLNTSIGSEKHLVPMTRNGMNRFSYRMATSGITNVWTEDGPGSGQSNTKKLSPVTERADGDRKSDHCNTATEISTDSERHSRTSGASPNTQTFSNGIDRERVSYNQTSDRERSSYSQTWQPNCSTQHIPQSDIQQQQEHLNTIKRRSYLLATASISDLTFLDTGLDLVDSSVSYNSTNSDRDLLNSATTHTQRTEHVTEFLHGQTKDTSCYNGVRQPSSKRNCSEINNKNCKSAARAAFSESTNRGRLTKELQESTIRSGPSVALDSSDVDSSDSGNTSCYYSASPDTSFVTADGDTLNSSHSHDSRHWSPGKSALHQNPRSVNQQHTDLMSPRFVSQNHVSHQMALRDQKGDSCVLSLEDRRSLKLRSNMDRSHDRSHDRSLQDQHLTILLSPGQRETSQPLSSHDPRHAPTNNNEHQNHSWHNTNNNTLSRKTNISQTTTGQKQSSPVNNVLQCYGCGLNDGQSTQTHPYINTNSSKGILTIARNRDINSTAHRRCPEDLRKTGVGKMHSERHHFIHPAGLPGNKPVRIRKYPAGPDLLLNQSSTSGFPSTSSFSSIASFADVMTWEEAPRFPPSLGRPRRKLYAGFDSQPLPMDSYTSDSSSVFSIQSCGSWGTSRSAEVERSSRFHEVAPSIRSVSSIAYGSTRSLTDSGEPGFLADSKNINLYNLYPHYNNSGIEDSLKDSFHGKNFSRESLESFLSDATTIGDNLDHKSDLTNLCTDYPPSDDVQYKNTTFVQSDQRTYEIPHADRLNKSCGSVLANTKGKLNGGNFDGKKKLHDISRASPCAPSPRPRPVPKGGKYLSSKDILDLILTPDKASKKDTVTLERQAQKVYEAILCCNEVEFQPRREYNF